MKVILIGRAAVGKTAILSRLITGDYFKDYFPTLGVDFMLKDYSKRAIYVHFFDFGGTSISNLLISPFLADTQLVLLVTDLFSVSEAVFFNNIIVQIQELNKEQVQFILIRNKIEIFPFTNNEIKCLKNFNQNKHIPIISVSAKTSENFTTLKREIFDKLALYSKKVYLAGAYFDCEMSALTDKYF